MLVVLVLSLKVGETVLPESILLGLVTWGQGRGLSLDRLLGRREITCRLVELALFLLELSHLSEMDLELRVLDALLLQIGLCLTQDVSGCLHSVIHLVVR